MAARHQTDTAEDDVGARFVEMEGCFNVRDLGGYPTADGREVRRGQIYRADALHRLTAAGRDRLATLEINTVIDLRTADEVTHRSWQPEPQWPGRRHHIRLRAATPNWSGLTTKQAADPDLAVAHYRDTVQQGGPALAAVFAVLAAPRATPTIFHCAAGKDRTGIVAALLLRLLGVDQQVVAADYALSDVATARWEASVAAGTADDTQTAWAFVPPAMLVADPDIMFRFLDWVDVEHGSTDNLLRRQGLDPAAITHLRHTLISSGPRPPSGD